MIIKTVEDVKREKIHKLTQPVMKNDHEVVTNIIANFSKKLWDSILDHLEIFTESYCYY